MSKAITEDMNLASKNLSQQFNKFILQPMRNLQLDEPATMVIVIDALDECDREEDIDVILRLLFSLQDISCVRLRIFLTSRPELPIRLGFKRNDKESENHEALVLHGLPKPDIERDIRLFLEHSLSAIREDRSLDLDWPGKAAIDDLVDMAVPLFIFAATICRYVGEKRWHPPTRLAAFFQDQANSSSSQMTRTYLPVLHQLHADMDDEDKKAVVEQFRNIVGTIVLLASPLSVNALAKLLGLPKENIAIRLDDLHSVLSVPEDRNMPIRLLHLSFRDFLVSITSEFHVA
jgi:hypothetical protein